MNALLLIAQIALGAAGPILQPSLIGGGTATGGIAISGTCTSSATGDVVCFDNNGTQAGWPTTDALADDLRLYGFSASPIGAGANLVGQDVNISPGQGSMTLVATQANCGAGDTVSVTIDGTTTTCTRDAALDDATHFTCGASDAAMATNVAACLTQATGISSCAGAGCTLFTGVAGTAYVYRASNESAGAGVISVASSGNHAVAANGTDGVVNVYGNLTLPTANTLSFGTFTLLTATQTLATTGQLVINNSAGTNVAGNGLRIGTADANGVTLFWKAAGQLGIGTGAFAAAGALDSGATTVTSLVSSGAVSGTTGTFTSTLLGGAFGCGIATITSVDSPYTVPLTVCAVICNATGGAITVTAAAASTVTGRVIDIKKSDVGANACTFDPAGSETINSNGTTATTHANAVPGASFTYRTDASNWFIF